ncbi:hypothetical protein C1645_776369 [Glomus cerebriforme]|uniref:MARVEL domain-containing protein n=1 Tax=Glomus cerebriforme TaxID=658196 RepID=A0A397SQ72_9GLOM|nr:hypothetical protein C1645_776369 [Glomus cerebriforme]
MAPQVSTCCCCVPLKAGAVIVTLFWLVFGIYVTVRNSLAIASFEFTFKFNEIQSILVIVLDGLISMGAAFGLFVLTCANTSKMLSIYSMIANGIVGINIVNYTIAIIIAVVYKSAILNACIADSTTINGDIKAECNDGYNYIVSTIILNAIITTILSVYFSIVISSYAQKRKGKERAVADEPPPYDRANDNSNDEKFKHEMS